MWLFLDSIEFGGIARNIQGYQRENGDVFQTILSFFVISFPLLV